MTRFKRTRNFSLKAFFEKEEFLKDLTEYLNFLKFALYGIEIIVN